MGEFALIVILLLILGIKIPFPDLSPFDFFRQETSHADVVIKTEAMSKVLLISAIMGPEKTRTEMLPYLQSEIIYSGSKLINIC